MLQRCVCVHARAHVARDRTRCRAARHARGHGLVLLHTRVCYTHTSPTSTRASTTSTATYLFAHTPQRTDKRWRSRRRSRNLARGREAEAGAEEARESQAEAPQGERPRLLLSSARLCSCLGSFSLVVHIGAPCPRLQERQRRSLALHRSFVLDTVTYVTCVCRDLVDCLSLESGTSWGRHA